MNLNVTIENSKWLFNKMGLRPHTYQELLEESDYTELELCYAILYLLKTGKIRQYKATKSIIYRVSL